MHHQHKATYGEEIKWHGQQRPIMEKTHQKSKDRNHKVIEKPKQA
jgi:hypothetical protein